MNPGINTDEDKDVADILKENAEESEKKPTLGTMMMKRERDGNSRGEMSKPLVSLHPHSTAWWQKKIPFLNLCSISHLDLACVRDFFQ